MSSSSKYYIFNQGSLISIEIDFRELVAKYAPSDIKKKKKELKISQNEMN